MNKVASARAEMGTESWQMTFVAQRVHKHHGRLLWTETR